MTSFTALPMFESQFMHLLGCSIWNLSIKLQAFLSHFCQQDLAVHRETNVRTILDKLLKKDIRTTQRVQATYFCKHHSMYPRLIQIHFLIQMPAYIWAAHNLTLKSSNFFRKSETARQCIFLITISCIKSWLG